MGLKYRRTTQGKIRIFLKLQEKKGKKESGFDLCYDTVVFFQLIYLHNQSRTLFIIKLGNGTQQIWFFKYIFVLTAGLVGFFELWRIFLGLVLLFLVFSFFSLNNLVLFQNYYCFFPSRLADLLSLIFSIKWERREFNNYLKLKEGKSYFFAKIRFKLRSANIAKHKRKKCDNEVHRKDRQSEWVWFVGNI